MITLGIDVSKKQVDVALLKEGSYKIKYLLIACKGLIS
jgi:hypothetical protein